MSRGKAQRRPVEEAPADFLPPESEDDVVQPKRPERPFILIKCSCCSWWRTRGLTACPACGATTISAEEWNA